MKPCNLEEYLANPNKKLVTRDGREVERILCTDAVGTYPIVAFLPSLVTIFLDGFLRYSSRLNGFIFYSSHSILMVVTLQVCALPSSSASFFDVK